MNRITLAALAFVVALPACSKNEQSASAPSGSTAIDVAQAEKSADRSVAAPAAADGAAGGAKAGTEGTSAVPSAAIPVSMPMPLSMYSTSSVATLPLAPLA